MRIESGKKRILTTWTKERDAVLLARYPNTRKKKIADELGVSVSAIYARAIELGCGQQKKVPWSEEETQFLIDNGHQMTASEIGRKLDRTRQSVNSKAVSLGIEMKKPESTNKERPVMVTRREESPFQKTDTGYIYRGIDHFNPSSTPRKREFGIQSSLG